MPQGLNADLQYWVSGFVVTAVLGFIGLRNKSADQLVEVLKQSDQLRRDNQVLAQENAQARAECAQAKAERDAIQRELTESRAEATRMREWATKERDGASAACRDRDACREDCAKFITQNGMLEAENRILTEQVKDIAELRSEVFAIHLEDARSKMTDDPPAASGTL